MFVTGALVALLIAAFLVAARIDKLQERLATLEMTLEARSRSTDDQLAALSATIDTIMEVVSLSMPARARDRLQFRNAKELTLDEIQSWTPGQVVHLVEADWDPDHEDPMISKYEFRFRSVAGHSEGERGHAVNGEWRFASTEPWKEYSFRARERSADARLLGM